MYFIYIFILYYTSSLLPSINTYVVLSANLNDFRSLAKKYVPDKNLVDQIKVMVLETDQKNNNRETLKVNDLDRTVEYVEEEQDDTYEVQKPVYKHQLKTPPRVSLLDSQDPPLIREVAASTVITVDDLVDELKHRILQENIDSGDHNAQVYTQVNDAPEEQSETIVYKTVQNKLKSSIPMKVFKEEVQFGGTYEDTIDENVKPQIQYLGQIQIPAHYLNSKPVKDETLTKKVIPKKQRFVSPKHFGTGKKVRYIKQVLVPSKSKITDYLLQPKLVELVLQQPNLGQKASLGQHPNTVKQSTLEPQLSLMQQSSEMKLPLDQQPSIIQHLALMKQQINRLNKIVEQNLVQNKPSTTLEAPQLNIDAGEAPFEILQNPKEDDQKTNDTTEDELQEAEDTLSEEATTEPVDTQTSTKENEQFIEENEEIDESAENEENTAGTVENEKVKEAHSNDVEESTPNEATTPAEAILVKADIIPRLDETPKTHTQEFGNPAAGEPIVEKTYNFNAPIAETKAPVDLKLPVDSARKVLLF